MYQQWIPVEKIQKLIQIESFALLVALLFVAVIFYKFFLKKITQKRHRNLQQRFIRIFIYFFITTLLAALQWPIFEYAHHSNIEFQLIKFASYLSLFSLVFGVATVIKLSQIYVYQYLFFMNMNVGVPRLLANMFTLIFSLALISWIATDIFSFHLAAVLATSAVFSLVLGLALQDTLGNLFAGVALQIDPPFIIGDWVDVQIGSEKWTGCIQEISWRATTLMSFSDEFILIPNRVIAQGQLINFSNTQKATRLNQTFRFRFDVSIPLAKKALLDGLIGIAEILDNPAPRVLVTDVTESWVALKVIYSLDNYGAKYRVADLIITQILNEIHRHGLILASQKIHLVSNEIGDKS
jgi:small-conductance mechanosensitive channel